MLTLTRLTLHTTHFLSSITHPSESLFISSFHLSLSVLLAGLQTYTITHGPGTRWLKDTVYILYWTYAALSLSNAVAHYYVLIARSAVRPIPYSPAVFLPGYSAMLTGTVASMIAGHQSPERAGKVVLSGVAWQGFGWCISFVTIVSYVRNILDHGLPPKKVRPGMFIPVGACAYTIVALVGLAQGVPDVGAVGFFARYPHAGEVLRVVAVILGLFLYVFAFWLFALAVLANVQAVVEEGTMEFSLGWWAFIFPNVSGAADATPSLF